MRCAPRVTPGASISSGALLRAVPERIAAHQASRIAAIARCCVLQMGRALCVIREKRLNTYPSEGHHALSKLMCLFSLTLRETNIHKPSEITTHNCWT